MQDFRSLPAVLRLPLAVLRFGVGALVVCGTAGLAILRGFARLYANEGGSGDRDDGHFETSSSIDAVDDPVNYKVRQPRIF